MKDTSLGLVFEDFAAAVAVLLEISTINRSLYPLILLSEYAEEF
jgi:hypothetical protein